MRIKRNAVRGKDGKPVTVTKFKLRCSRFLYTLTLLDKDKADKLRQSLPPGASPFKVPLNISQCANYYIPKGLTVDEVTKTKKK